MSYTTVTFILAFILVVARFLCARACLSFRTRHVPLLSLCLQFFGNASLRHLSTIRAMSGYHRHRRGGVRRLHTHNFFFSAQHPPCRGREAQYHVPPWEAKRCSHAISPHRVRCHGRALHWRLILPQPGRTQAPGCPKTAPRQLRFVLDAVAVAAVGVVVVANEK